MALGVCPGGSRAAGAMALLPSLGVGGSRAGEGVEPKTKAQLPQKREGSNGKPTHRYFLRGDRAPFHDAGRRARLATSRSPSLDAPHTIAPALDVMGDELPLGLRCLADRRMRNAGRSVRRHEERIPNLHFVPRVFRLHPAAAPARRLVGNRDALLD